MAAATLNIGTNAQQRGQLVFTGANDIGPNLVITLPIVQLLPAGALNFIGDEYGVIELNGEVLADDTGSFGTAEHPDDTATTPDIGNYYVGTGVVTWTPEPTATVPTPLEVDLGNCNVFEFTQAAEPLPHWNHRGGIRKKDFNPIVEQSATVRLELTEWSPENLRLALQAAPAAGP
jgi:hypothetical protein